jgi:hypothetical protein
LFPGTFTSWDILENLFIEKYFPRKHPYSLLLKLIQIQMSEEDTIKDSTFIFMKVLHDIAQEMFPNYVIIFSCYENSLRVNMQFLLNQEGKFSWKDLMQQAQFIGINVLETIANLLNFPILLQYNGGMDLEEIFDKICEICFSRSCSWNRK